MSGLGLKAAGARKTVVAVLGLIGQVVAAGVLDGTALHWAQVILAAGTALGVYQVPNARPPAPGVAVSAAGRHEAR
jgi:hypothetical protein